VKKLLALLILSGFLVGVVGCGGPDTKTTATTPPKSTSKPMPGTEKPPVLTGKAPSTEKPADTGKLPPIGGSTEKPKDSGKPASTEKPKESKKD
jgi:hypothetical protein